MYTNEILARALKGQAHGYSMPADLLPLLNTAVQILYKHECPQTMLIDPTTGRPPILATTAGLFGPYLGPANTWRIGKVLIYHDDVTVDYGLVGLLNTAIDLDTTDVVTINGNEYYVFPYTRTEDALEGALPQLWFTQDPTTTTTQYYLQCYKQHPQITSDRVQLRIPDSGGAHQTIVLPALMKLIEGQNHGNYIEAVEYIEQTMKPRLWAMMGKGAHGARHQTTRRPW
jgi:hypothetical protein